MQKVNAQSTQQIVDIDKIRDGIVILKDGTLRAILMCSSLNFALKSQEEQDAIVYQYQNFLNSLDFPIQFAVHSRKLNIQHYLDSIREYLKKQKNELLRAQTEEYIDFIDSFVKTYNVMSKTFYVVVPFSRDEGKSQGFFARLFSGDQKSFIKMSDEEFEKYKNQLLQRVDNVIAGLRSIGVRSEMLEGDELLELFFDMYNPEEPGKEVLKGLEENK